MEFKVGILFFLNLVPSEVTKSTGSYLLYNWVFAFMIGLREWFSQTDERNAPPRIPVMVNMSSASVSSRKGQKLHDFSVNSTNRNSVMMDEYSDEDEEFQIAEAEQEVWFRRVLFFFPHILFKNELFIGVIIFFINTFRHTKMVLRTIWRRQVNNYFFCFILNYDPCLSIWV